MTFPLSTTIPTSNLNSPDSDPSLARVDLLQAVQLLNQIIASANSNNGVLVLNSLGIIAASRLPGNLTITGDISLQPSTGVINVNRVLRLQNTFTTDLGTAATGTTAPSAGDLVFLVDGDAGQPCIGCYDGANWRVIRFMTQVGDVGADLTVTATVVAEGIIV